jgi:hypothetical protein
VPNSKEISNRALNTGVFLIVPVYAQSQKARVKFVLRCDGAPDMRYFAGALQIGYDQRFPDRDWPRVPVAVLPVWVTARAPHGADLFYLG